VIWRKAKHTARSRPHETRYLGAGTFLSGCVLVYMFPWAAAVGDIVGVIGFVVGWWGNKLVAKQAEKNRNIVRLEQELGMEPSR
jgi:hypothetical protein